MNENSTNPAACADVKFCTLDEASQPSSVTNLVYDVYECTY